MCYVSQFGSLPWYYVFPALRIVITATVACVCGGLLCGCDCLTSAYFFGDFFCHRHCTTDLIHTHMCFYYGYGNSGSVLFAIC